jgi:hypothetical protein
MASETVEANGSRPSSGDEAGPHFDLETYSSNYAGHTKIIRLRFIAEKTIDPTTELEALRMALDEIKKGENTQVYVDTIERARGRLGRAYQHDRDWVNNKEKQAAQRQERLELELIGYKVLLFCTPLSGAVLLRRVLRQREGSFFGSKVCSLLDKSMRDIFANLDANCPAR